MATEKASLSPYFTIDDLADRWGLSRNAVCSYGADGQLSCGVFVTGHLHVEVGTHGHAPEYEFKVESNGLWRGYVPVTAETVAAIWLNSETAHLFIPDTDCKKHVHVLEYLPIDECDKGPRLVVAGDEVERFEREVLRVCDKPVAGLSSGANGVWQPELPDEWQRGLKLMAWHEAVKLVASERALPGLALWLALCARDDIKAKGRDSNKIEPKTIQNGWVRGEVEISKTQVCGQWRTKLERLLLPAKA